MHLTLLFPGLLWPAAAGDEPYRQARAPALELALGRARIAGAAGGTLAWLARQWQLGDAPPWGALSLLGDGGTPDAHFWMRADPVHLRVHRDHLVLADATAFAIAQTEAHAITDALNAHFAGDGFAFHPLRPDRWYLRVAAPPRLRTTPLAEVAGRDIEGRLPAGDDALAWHRHVNEIQMLLHALPANEARETRGELPVNSVWPWGGGVLPQGLPRPFEVIACDDPVIAGLALASGADQRPAAAGLDAMLPTPPRNALVVDDTFAAATRYGDLTAWQQALARSDAAWIAPALDALRAGRLAGLDLVLGGGDRMLTASLTRGELRRFWRRPHPLTRLARP